MDLNLAYQFLSIKTALVSHPSRKSDFQALNGALSGTRARMQGIVQTFENAAETNMGDDEFYLKGLYLY
jgi:hypothetical protein